MGIFGFACARCWDKDCKCTPEELQEFNHRKEEITPTPVVVSESYPPVAAGDIILKGSHSWFVKSIVAGLPLCDKITNQGGDELNNTIILPPYEKVASINPPKFN
jgi:hypothetical protein